MVSIFNIKYNIQVVFLGFHFLFKANKRPNQKQALLRKAEGSFLIAVITDVKVRSASDLQTDVQLGSSRPPTSFVILTDAPGSPETGHSSPQDMRLASEESWRSLQDYDY